MEIGTFLSVYLFLCLASSLFTEFVKKWRENQKKDPSANFISVLNGIFIGGIGMAIYLFTHGFPFNLMTFITIGEMTVAIIAGSGLGYDRVKALLEKAKEV